MENKMALTLATPIEQLVPALIAWNNTELMEAVKYRLVEYQEKNYDDDSIAEAKADRATLNKFAQALYSERQTIGKVYTAPLDKFKAEVDEVIAEVKKVSATIDEQVKVYEDKKQREKLEAVREYFDSVFPSDLVPFIAYEKIHRKEWLNASKSMASVKKEIDEIIKKINSELNTIEALGGEQNTLKAIYFRSLNLAEAITENERLNAEKRRIAEAQAAKQETLRQEEKAEIQQSTEPTQTAEKLYSIAFKVTGTAEQLNALSAFMKNNNIKFTRA